MTEPIKKTRRRRRKKGGGRKPIPGRIRVSSNARDYRSVHLAFSEDVIEKLVELYDEDYREQIPIPILRGEARYNTLRLEFVRLAWMGIPAVMVRIEPPSFDPHGSRIRRIAGSRQYMTQILAEKIGIKNGIQNQLVEYFWADLPNQGPNPMHGVIMQFEDFEMLLPPPGVIMGPNDLTVVSTRR